MPKIGVARRLCGTRTILEDYRRGVEEGSVGFEYSKVEFVSHSLGYTHRPPDPDTPAPPRGRPSISMTPRRRPRDNG
jgi:hypothetical protein